MSIGDWMDTPQGGKITGYAFGFGAAVVIVGALFKIMHWPGASVVLTMGMGTEAVLFVITAFGNPHPVLHWDRAFPVISDHTPEGAAFLDGHSSGIANPLAAASGSGVSGGTVVVGGNGGSVSGGTLNAIAGTDVSLLSEEDIKKLNSGISKLSETAEKLSNLGAAGDSAAQFVNNIASANTSLNSYTNSQNQINEATASLINSYKSIAADVENAKQSTTAYASVLSNVNNSLSSANSAYELQLKAIESANNEIEAFRQNTAKLNSQVANLNNIYGNMLNALA